MFFKKLRRRAKRGEKEMEPAELFNKVKTLAKQGLTQKQIAEQLGFKTPFTLNNRLVRASQASGKPFPPSGSQERTRRKNGLKWLR